MAPPTQSLFTTQNRCAACGATLRSGYYYLHDRPERYCAACITARPRCDGCAAPVGDAHWTLHDGRVLCARCHATAIYDPQHAQQLYADTVGAVIAQLGLRLQVGAVFRLVDAPTLEQVRAGGGDALTEEQQCRPPCRVSQSRNSAVSAHDDGAHAPHHILAQLLPHHRIAWSSTGKNSSAPNCPFPRSMLCSAYRITLNSQGEHHVCTVSRRRRSPAR